MNPRALSWNPALTTIAVVISVVASAALLNWVTLAGTETDTTLVASGSFKTWIGLGALAIVAFSDSLISGVRELRTVTRCYRSGRASPTGYTLLFLAFATVAVTALRTASHGGPAVAIQYWPEISAALLLLGTAGSGPWIIIVWTLHSTLGRTRAAIVDLPTVGVSATAGSAGLDSMMTTVVETRKVITRAISRLLVLVLCALALSGALRAALVPDHLAEKEFPATAVLLYGAFFTLTLGLAVIPLVGSWRETASTLVDQAYPLHVANTADEAAARARLQAIFCVDGTLLASPLALGAILAPLLTSTLAIFLPKLGA